MVTCRRPGDRIVLPGLAGAKRVQDLLVDAKVPRDRRDAVPLLRSGGQVAWVVGLRVAAWARADAGAPGRLVEFLPDESRMHAVEGAVGA